MDDVAKDVEQVVTTVADNVIAEDSADVAMDGSNATADATTETKLNGHAAAEDTASSLGREELAAVTATQVRPLRPSVQPGLRLGMPG